MSLFRRKTILRSAERHTSANTPSFVPARILCVLLGTWRWTCIASLSSRGVHSVITGAAYVQTLLAVLGVNFAGLCEQAGERVRL